MNLRLALWNVQWASPATARGLEIRRILQNCHAGLICIPEGCAGLLPDAGHVIVSLADYGYTLREGRRKVLLWSPWPWHKLDFVGSPELPSGRFVRGSLLTPHGEITVIGVCIPWPHAHVTTGRRDRRPWADHAAYLNALGNILRVESANPNLLVIGDFNQRLPSGRAPKAMRELLLRTLGGLKVCTTGVIAGVNGLSIDHVAHSAGLAPVAVSGWNATGADGKKLSDHFGVAVDFEASWT